MNLSPSRARARRTPGLPDIVAILPAVGPILPTFGVYLREVASKLEELCTERGDLMGDLEEIVHERGEIVGMLVALGGDLFEVTRKLEELGDEGEELMGDLEEIVDKREEIVGILVALGADLRELASKLEELGDEREEVMGDLEEIVDECVEILGILVTLPADLLEIPRKLEELSDEREEVVADLEEIIDERVEIVGILFALPADLLEIPRKLEELSDEREEVIADLEEIVDEGVEIVRILVALPADLLEIARKLEELCGEREEVMGDLEEIVDERDEIVGILLAFGADLREVVRDCGAERAARRQSSHQGNGPVAKGAVDPAFMAHDGTRTSARVSACLAVAFAVLVASFTWGGRAAAAVPALVQHVGSTTELAARAIQGNDIKFTPPNPVLSGNCLILGVAYTSGTPFAASPVTDTNGNAWPTSPAASRVDSAGIMDLAIFVLPNARPGPTTVTLHFAHAIPQFQYSFSEFDNVATSAPVSGSSGAAQVQAPALSTGTFTPGNNDANGGNLVWSTFFDDSSPGSGDDVTAFTPGPGFALLDADTAWHFDANVHHTAEYTVQTTAAPINPSMTAAMSPSPDRFVGLSIALKAASAGTAPATPSAAIRIAKVLHYTNEVPPSTLTAQVPSSGNLLVFSTANASGFGDIASVTDSKGNAYTKVQPDSTEPQFFVAPHAVTGSDLVLTAHLDGNASGMSFTVFDIVGAASSPLGAIGHMPAVNCSNLSFIANAPSITPTAAGGLTIAVMGLGQGPGTGLGQGSPTNAVFDMATYTGETDLDTMENADSRAHLYNTSTAVESWSWAISSQPNNSCFATAIHLLPGSTTVPIVPAMGTIHIALGALALLVVGAASKRRQSTNGTSALRSEG